MKKPDVHALIVAMLRKQWMEEWQIRDKLETKGICMTDSSAGRRMRELRQKGHSIIRKTVVIKGRTYWRYRIEA